jgi:hypothetical protein
MTSRLPVLTGKPALTKSILIGLEKYSNKGSEAKISKGGPRPRRIKAVNINKVKILK